MARANFDFWQKLNRQGMLKAGQKYLKAAFIQRGILPDREKEQITAAYLLESLNNSPVHTAEMLMPQLQGKFKILLKQEYEAFADDIMFSLIECHNPNALKREQAVQKLVEFSEKIRGPLRQHLLNLSSYIYLDLINTYFNTSQLQKMSNIIKKIKKSAAWLDPKQRYNVAVAEYLVGNRRFAIEQFNVLKNQIPQAYCSLAVHAERLKQFTNAYNLFALCQKNGVHYPQLVELLPIKAAIFGPLSNGSQKKEGPRGVYNGSP
jgi:hypothetical protein